MSQIMLHLLAANYDWHHHITPTSEEIRVFATIFPMVSLSIVNILVVRLANMNPGRPFPQLHPARCQRRLDIERKKSFILFQGGVSVAYPNHTSGCNLILSTLTFMLERGVPCEARWL